MNIEEFKLFIIFLLNGILMSFIFDIFRAFRKTFNIKDIIIYLQDIIFWIISGFIILYSVYTFSNGELRLYMLLGIILGSIIYLLLISKYFIKYFGFCLTKIKNILDKIIYIIFFPFKKIFNLLKGFFKNLSNKNKNLQKNIISNIKNDKKAKKVNNIEGF